MLGYSNLYNGKLTYSQPQTFIKVKKELFCYGSVNKDE